jgi:hypothetical protein
MGRVTRIHGGGVLILKQFSSVCTLDPSKKDKIGGVMPFLVTTAENGLVLA